MPYQCAWACSQGGIGGRGKAERRLTAPPFGFALCLIPEPSKKKKRNHVLLPVITNGSNPELSSQRRPSGRYRNNCRHETRMPLPITTNYCEAGKKQGPQDDSVPLNHSARKAGKIAPTFVCRSAWIPSGPRATAGGTSAAAIFTSSATL